MFELALKQFIAAVIPQEQVVAKFPAVRRDIAVIVDQTVTAATILQIVRQTAAVKIHIFDVYQGPGVAPGKKSIALGLILQNFYRTLVDAEVTALIDKIVAALNKEVNAVLRT